MLQKERENRRLLPIFVQFHTLPEARTVEAHLTDRLAVETLGRWNLELKKNVTIDSFAVCSNFRLLYLSYRNHIFHIVVIHTSIIESLNLKLNHLESYLQYTDSWRDEAGFIVTDRNRYEYATFDAKQFVSTLRPSSG